MADCPLLSTCPFFNDMMANMPAMSEGMKKEFCHQRFIQCARYMTCTALGRDKVPADMFPNEPERAKEIIDASRQL
ncbi:hypothetical protein ACFL5J_02605 [Thermodesulfobacteriota bacterium]